MQTWEDLVKTALLGTERQAPPLSAKEDIVFGNLLAHFGEGDRERALLGAGGVLTLARRAGYLPARSAKIEALAFAELDDLPLCREAAVHDLSRLLDGEHEPLFPEWLTLVTAYGQRVPERYLPALLMKGERSKEFRSVMLPVLGKRGRWLAAQNRPWHFALQQSLFEGDVTEAKTMPADLTEAVWETALREERVSYLAALRTINPTEAREKLAAVWAQEPHEERAVFLGTFGTGLSAEDEPFLDAALDDKRKEVRTVAQELLRKLPGSRLGQRMAERARKLVTLDGVKVVVTLPDTFDKVWARDGIEQKPPSYPKIGEKTFWLTQILAATPLSFWMEYLAREPERLIRIATSNGDWGNTLIESWTRALAEEQGHSEWAEPLLEYWLTEKNETRIPVAVPWGRVLARERLEVIALRNFEVGRLQNYSAVLRAVLIECGPVWSVALVDRCLEQIRPNVSQKNPYQFVYILQQFADYFPEDRLPEVYDLWGQMLMENDYYRRELERHAAQREFRREMRRHISGE